MDKAVEARLVEAPLTRVLVAAGDTEAFQLKT